MFKYILTKIKDSLRLRSDHLEQPCDKNDPEVGISVIPTAFSIPFIVASNSHADEELDQAQSNSESGDQSLIEHIYVTGAG